jgi:hypothetical protein
VTSISCDRRSHDDFPQGPSQPRLEARNVPFRLRFWSCQRYISRPGAHAMGGLIPGDPVQPMPAVHLAGVWLFDSSVWTEVGSAARKPGQQGPLGDKIKPDRATNTERAGTPARRAAPSIEHREQVPASVHSTGPRAASARTGDHALRALARRALDWWEGLSDAERQAYDQRWQKEKNDG